MSAKVCLVDWLDSCTEGGWVATNHVMPRSAHCQTVGFIVEEDKERIVLALSRAANEFSRPWGDLIAIPKGCIIKRRIMK